MGDLIELKEGSFPWDPPGADRIDILNQYGIPTAGLIQQFGQEYYFFCLEGEADAANVWAYIPIEPVEATLTKELPREQAFRQLIADGRAFEVGLSLEGQGLIRWARVDGAQGPDQAREVAFLVLDVTSEDLDRLTTA